MSVGRSVSGDVIRVAQADSQSWCDVPNEVIDMGVLHKRPADIQLIEEWAFIHRPNKKCCTCYTNFCKLFYALLYKFRQGDVFFSFQFKKYFATLAKNMYDDIFWIHCSCMDMHADFLQGQLCSECEIKAMKNINFHLNVFFELSSSNKPPLQFATAASCLYYFTWYVGWVNCKNGCIEKEYRSLYYYS